jgi:hypothetical protein
MKNDNSFSIAIVEFNKKTSRTQVIIWFVSFVLCCFRLGFNDGLLYWLIKILSYIFDISIFKEFWWRYVIAIASLNFILIKIIFIFIAIIKYKSARSVNKSPEV